MIASFLPWWGWLLLAVGFFAANFFLRGASRTNSVFLMASRWLLAAGTGFCLILGVVRFIKWAWRG
jgi:hypothetical protein